MRDDYFLLNPIHRALIDVKDALITMIRNYKFPLKSFLIVLIIIAIISYYVYIIVANKFVPLVRAEYSKEGFETVEQINKDTLSLENSNFIMEMDVDTTTLSVKDKVSNEVWTSNLKAKDGIYPDSYPNLNEETKERQQSTLIVNYSVLYGKIESMSNYKYSIKDQTYKIRVSQTEASIEVLYKIGDFSIDYKKLPMFMSMDRFETIILANVEKISDDFIKEDAKIALKLYKKMEDKGMYILTNPSSISKGAINDLYNIFYNYCGYNEAELAYDNQQFGVETELNNKFFEVAIKYQLTEFGFNAKIINDSILENSDYPLVSIDFLPYFSAGSVDDDGYMFIPDGSGTLINYNNNKTYALNYNKRYYGDEALFSPFKKKEAATNLNFPLYGAKRNDQAYLAIIEDGAEMGYLNADISNKKDSYNIIYPRFYYREGQQVIFSTWNNSLETTSWSKYYSLTDYNVSFHLFSNEMADYNQMAKTYSSYLFKEVNRNKTGLALNLSLLGGYTKQDYFLGIPYTKVDSLTNTKQAKQIIEELRSKNLNMINLTYQGWFNDGIKHFNVSNFTYNNIVGSKNDFNELSDYLNSVNVDFYPEINFNIVNTSHKFNENDASKDLFSKTIRQHPYDSALAAQDVTKPPFYYLNPSKYNTYINNFLSNYDDNSFKGLGFIDVGATLSGSYAKTDYNLRTTTLDKVIEVFNKVEAKNYQIMTRSPNAYAITHSSLILDAPINGTDYNIIDSTIPFYQLVLSGIVSYSPLAINLNDEVEYNYQKLKIIETGSDIAMTWSYEKTNDLIKTDFNQYYSTYYQNWMNKTVDLYQEITNLGIGNCYLVNHQYLTNKVVMVTYSNGKQIIINYGTTPYLGINSMDYKEVI